MSLCISQKIGEETRASRLSFQAGASQRTGHHQEVALGNVSRCVRRVLQSLAGGVTCEMIRPRTSAVSWKACRALQSSPARQEGTTPHSGHT